MGVLHDLARYLWRLLPANPIMVRVVAAGGKRTRHLWARVAYLAVLFAVMLLGGQLFADSGASLAQLAKGSTQMFISVSFVQLLLMSFVAPIFTAGAISQERDGNTFDILLTTPLSNAQIVFGTLLSRLFFVWALLLSGLPIFCITMIYGGVTTNEVFLSFGLAACTALLTGSVAITISMMRLGTRRTIFAFFCGVAAYLLGVGALGWSGLTAVPEAAYGVGTARQMSWLAPFHPFLALLVVVGETPAPELGRVAHYGWPWAPLLAAPHYGYMVLTVLAALAMVGLSLAFVRRGARTGESRWRTWLAERLLPRGGERTRRARRVWSNPIAWREAATRGTRTGRALLRGVFILGGLALGVTLLVAYERGWQPLTSGGTPDPAAMRAWLVAIVWIEMAITLLVVTATAAGTLTREKESQTIEILLTTPLTSRYIVGGMLQGLVRFAVPLAAVPTGTLLVFVLADLLTARPAVLSAEAVLLVPLLLLACCAVAALVGLRFSLTSRKTAQAVMLSTAVVLGASGLLGLCGAAIVSGVGAEGGAVVSAFSPFIAVQALIDPTRLFAAGATIGPGELAAVRTVLAIMVVVACAALVGVTYSLYGNMVRGFDMVIRRQSA
jgi:ABC-type transport system involved in multi-copper enzyme maturation permease subunit